MIRSRVLCAHTCPEARFRGAVPACLPHTGRATLRPAQEHNRHRRATAYLAHTAARNDMHAKATGWLNGPQGGDKCVSTGHLSTKQGHLFQLPKHRGCVQGKRRLAMRYSS